jgi:hypothetical protein
MTKTMRTRKMPRMMNEARDDARAGPKLLNENRQHDYARNRIRDFRRSSGGPIETTCSGETIKRDGGEYLPAVSKDAPNQVNLRTILCP